ncbi:hypothetical protein AB0H29_31040 [Streptomyces thermolilacinus]
MLFAVLPLLSCGLLMGGAMLRLALVTRRQRDWWLFGASVVLTLTAIVLMPEDADTLRADLVVGGLLLSAAAFTGYFLYADIRHFDPNAPAPAAPSPYATTFPSGTASGPAPGYGYPAPQGQAYPGTPTPVPSPYAQPQPQPAATAQPPVTAQPQPPQTPPQAQPQTRPGPPAGPRIDQVRAELDELSDLLRRDDGTR